MELESMEHEEKLIELLGFKLVGPIQNTCFNILNDNDEIVGFVRAKRVQSDSFGYQMVIESDRVSYNSIRPFQDEDKQFFYLFHIKDEQNRKQEVWLNLERNHLGMTIKSDSMGEAVFKLTPDLMYLNFKRDTYQFHKEEVVELYNGVFENTYRYQMRFCKKEESLMKESDTTVFDIRYKESPHEYLGGGNMLVETNIWKKNEKAISYTDFRDSTLEEEILSHKRGIEAFRHFRKYLNETLPFQTDIIDAMIEQKKAGFNIDSGIGREVAVFLPQLNSQVEKKLVK